MIERNRRLKDVLWALALAGAVAIGFRLWFGLGATTNLTDSVPWGLWKILNMVAGVALSTGGFTVGFLVYVLKLERFRPLVKPAILVAFLGYGSSCFALFLDIGLPHRIWHPIVMWNEHSFLFEVAWCVMLYFTVTIVELSPTLLERLRLAGIASFLHRIAFGVVIVGISLSSLHHSSLGSLFLVTPFRLHPLWYTPLLPLHFILSAMGSGLMVVVLIKLLYARWYDPASVYGASAAVEHRMPATVPREVRDRADGEPGPDFPMVRALATVGAAVLGVYLAVKLADLAATGGLGALLAGTWESWLYGIELLLSAVVPIAIVVWSRTRRSATAIAVAAGCAAAGLVLNRLDVGIFGYLRDASVAYVPSLLEWLVGLGVIAAATLVFLAVAERFPIFDACWRERAAERERFVPTFDHGTRVWRAALAGGLGRVSAIAVLVVPLVSAVTYPPFHASNPGDERPVRPPVARDAMRDVLRIDGNAAALKVFFPHKDHQQRLGKQDSCGRCHHLSLPNDHATPCSRCHRYMESTTPIFDHAAHFEAVAKKEALTGWIPANRSCSHCHEGEGAKRASNAKPCFECHEKDMRPAVEPEEAHALARANGYRAAMHGTCVECHKKEGRRLERPHLAECSNCHEGLTPAGDRRLLAGAASEPPRGG